MKLLAGLWSVSSGDAYIRITVLSLFAGHLWMWELQLFWASAGWVLLIGLVMLNGWFIRRVIERTPASANA